MQVDRLSKFDQQRTYCHPFFVVTHRPAEQPPGYLALQRLGVRQSPFATFIYYRVKSAGGKS
jgi:hypothetical protein